MREMSLYTGELEGILANRQNNQRDLLLAWAGKCAWEARLEEINRFAEAGEAFHMQSVAEIQTYFVARAIELHMARQLIDQLALENTGITGAPGGQGRDRDE